MTVYGTTWKEKAIWKVPATNFFHSLEQVKSETHSFTHSLTHLFIQQTFLASHRRLGFIWVLKGKQEFTMDKGVPLGFKRWHGMV